MRNLQRITPISVVVPVGPKAHHRQFLPEAIASIADQSRLPGEIVVVADGCFDLNVIDCKSMLGSHQNEIPVVVHHNPCNLGVVASLNIGVAVSNYDLVLLGCADDKFLANCVELCWQAWERYQEPLGYYYLGVEYSTGQMQNTACGAAMVTKDLWDYTGGFPAQGAVGAVDHIFLSCLIAGSRDGYSKAKILKVSEEVIYWYRVHDHTETRLNNIWPAIDAVRDRLTEEWRPRSK